MVHKKIKDDNYKVFALMSNYLNKAPDYVEKAQIEEIVEGTGLSYEYAFGVILAAAFGLDIVDNESDRELFNNYFPEMIHLLDTKEYTVNPYYKNIQIKAHKIGNSELKYEKYKTYEGFVYNDIVKTEEGRQIPQIGFFQEEFHFPAVLEDGRIWMTITPNEIETMKEPIEAAFGNVLAFGLGLGYFAYMVSEKDQVDRVTVVESNEHVIKLFKEEILPQFENKEKIRIVHDDAFHYAEKILPKAKYDFVFTDLWHDVGDGIDLYLKMKEYERLSSGTKFAYWIEKSILCYL